MYFVLDATGILPIIPRRFVLVLAIRTVATVALDQDRRDNQMNNENRGNPDQEFLANLVNPDLARSSLRGLAHANARPALQLVAQINREVLSIRDNY